MEKCIEKGCFVAIRHNVAVIRVPITWMKRTNIKTSRYIKQLDISDNESHLSFQSLKTLPLYKCLVR